MEMIDSDMLKENYISKIEEIDKRLDMINHNNDVLFDKCINASRDANTAIYGYFNHREIINNILKRLDKIENRLNTQDECICETLL